MRILVDTSVWIDFFRGEPSRAAVEKKYDAQFKVAFDAICQLMEPPPVKRRSIGFHIEGKKEH